MNKRIILAVTGASGTPYALAVAKALALALAEGFETHMIVSEAAKVVMAHETGLPVEELTRHATALYAESDIAAPPASGSWRHEAMVVCPCSMATLGAIAGGLGNNLIHRAADVALKERRKLVLVARETPLSAIHLENMLKATRAGAVVMPACPGFYAESDSAADLANHLAGRILDQLDVPHELYTPWGQNNGGQS